MLLVETERSRHAPSCSVVMIEPRYGQMIMSSAAGLFRPPEYCAIRRQLETRRQTNGALIVNGYFWPAKPTTGEVSKPQLVSLS